MSKRTVKTGGLYFLTHKKDESSCKNVVRICSQQNEENYRNAVYFQDFTSGKLVKYSGDHMIWTSTSEVEIEDVWEDFNVEFMGCDMKDILAHAYQDIASNV